MGKAQWNCAKSFKARAIHGRACLKWPLQDIILHLVYTTSKISMCFAGRLIPKVRQPAKLRCLTYNHDLQDGKQ